jgi:L-fuculose-phosphate aldolase
VASSDLGSDRDIRGHLVSYGRRLLDDGLAIGSSGNLSARREDRVLITPSGIGYRELRPGDICVTALDGTVLDAPEAPSTELPMHLAVYAAKHAGAVVHTHSPEVIALSTVCDDLPAIHYAITELGGPIRVVPYTRFGSVGLARAAVAALAGRRAAILASHGAVSYGDSLAEAYARALLLEWLAKVYRLARAHGTPRIMTDAELDEVVAEAMRLNYGKSGRGREPGGR